MPPERSAPAAVKPRVLLIDDSRVIRKAIGRILASEFDLREAEDGEAGWQELLGDERIQVIVTDMEMPRLDGAALIGRIRASNIPRIRDVPVIAITGAEDEETRKRTLARGATDFITKPVDTVQLLARVRAHIRLDQTARELSAAAATLEEQTAVDPLTQLNSRRFLMQRGAQDLAFAKRHKADLTVIRLDIDDFEQIRKQLGNDVCDRVLVWLARIVTATSRAHDTVARISGHRFAVIAPSAGPAEAAVLCERLRSVIVRQSFADGGTALAVTISLGAATFDLDSADTFEALLEEADRRTQLAKAAGGNRFYAGDHQQTPLSRPPTGTRPDLESALHLLARDDGTALVPHLPGLLKRIIPLLELANRKLDLGIGFAIASMKDKLSRLE